MTAAATPASSLPRKRTRAAARHRRVTAAAFMSPWIVGFSVFFAYPLVTSAYLSLTHYDGLSSPRWLGLANYRYLFGTDHEAWPAVRNTLWLLAFMVPIQVLFAFGIALMLSRARRGIGILRTIFYLPALAPPVAATIGFVYLLNPATGPLASGLGKLGIQSPLWFDAPHWVKPSLTLLAIWSVGNMMVIFLAAIIDVPRELHEAAAIDGAGAWARLVHVTLPSISPVILFSAVIAVVDALQYFDQAFVASSVAAGSAGQAADSVSKNLGAPGDATLFYPVRLYQEGFVYSNLGYASAMAVLLFLVAAGIAVLVIRRSRRWIYQQGAER